MLKDYRTWLESELKLLANASHHAYAFGQANMAKRALERLDAELKGRVPLLLERADAAALLAFLQAGEGAAAAPATLQTVREALTAALGLG